MRSHELAVKRIVRYLKGTKDKGYILKPTFSTMIDCYVDADFAGSWTNKTAHDSNSVRSRSGYVITYAGCPILWSSKLQMDIALSTTEAEYIVLSQSLRNSHFELSYRNSDQSSSFPFHRSQPIPQSLKITKAVFISLKLQPCDPSPVTLVSNIVISGNTCTKDTSK